MMLLIADGGSNLMSIFIILGLAIPLLTDFGIMEFLGTLIRKAVRFLFTLPGRSSIDLLGSWFSSSAASVLITRNQHEKGFYTGREAAAICVNFTLVSLPFTFVVASTAGLVEHFLVFYLVITVTTLLLAVIFPRIWPLRGIKDEYLPDVGKQIDEEVPKDVSMFSWATKLASKRASETGPADVVKSGLSNWLNIFMDLIPVILAWGTIALVVNEMTPVFEIISWPFGQFLSLLGVEQAMTYAPATVVGFVDMFIPAIMLGASDTVPFQTAFIIGALSIVQIIYLAETGILILKSRIPLHIGHLAILFVMRTIIAIPILVGLTWLIF
jgi:nucleoside recognition membrane protein YjiH